MFACLFVKSHPVSEYFYFTHFPCSYYSEKSGKGYQTMSSMACKIFVPVASNRAVAWDFILRVKIHTRSPVAPGIHPTFSM